MQQGALSRRPDAGNLLQAGLAQIAHAAGAMRTDREAVRLIAKPLDKIKHRIARRQLERVAPRKKEGLAAGITIRSFGDGGERYLDSMLGQNVAGGIELPLAAIDQHEIGPW